MKEKGSGIRLLQQESEIRTGGRMLSLFLLLLYFYIGVCGCVFGFLSVFEIPCDRQLLIGAVLIAGIFFAIICLAGRYAKILILLTAFVYGWMIYRNFDLLLAGGETVLEVIRRVISSYQNGGIVSVSDLAMHQKETFAVLMAVIFPWAGTLFSGLVLRGGRLVIVVSIAIVMSSVLAVGQVPDFTPACMMICCLIGAFSTDGLEHMQGQRTGTILAALLAVFSLTVGADVLSPVIEPWFAGRAAVKTKIQNGALMKELDRRFSGWNTPWATAGVGNGELGIADFVSSTNKRILKVTTDYKPKEMVYLKCYTGANYTGNRWVELDESMSDFAEEQYFESFLTTAEGNGVAQPYEMEIQLQEDAGDYDYQPYYSSPDGKADRTLSYSFYPGELIGRWDTVMPERLFYENNYSGFVYGSYTSYPEQSLQRLREVCTSYIPEDVEDLCRFIKNYLKESASYSLNVGRFPEDEDFTEYFLFEKHEGYCVHFATAATLMFRMYGLASRYVTGYVASPKDFKKDGNRYSAWVRDSRAHAWTEIYLENKGWVPVEVTPGYTEMGEASDETEEQTESVRQKETEKQKESENDRQKEQEEESGKIPAWVFWMLFGSSFVVLTFCGRRQWMRKRRRKEGVKEIFYDVCSILALAGFAEEADCQEEAFLENAMARFPWLGREEFSALIDLAVRANFAGEAITKEERRFAGEMYRDICREVYRELPVRQKILFRWWYCFQ